MKFNKGTRALRSVGRTGSHRGLQRAVGAVIEALESRQMFTIIAADLTGGAGTASADQYTGVAGNGWAVPWATTVASASFGSASVASATPLNGGGNYLSLTQTATAASGAGSVSRGYQTTGNVSTAAV